MAIGKDEFRAALSRFASGVTVVTTKDAQGNLHGITVSAFCSVSLEPPLILICVEKNPGSHYALTETAFFSVNILRQEQRHLSEKFASFLSNKFEDVETVESDHDLPLIADALVNLECRLVSSHASGDHTIFVGEIEQALINDGSPLVYFMSDYRNIE